MSCLPLVVEEPGRWLFEEFRVLFLNVCLQKAFAAHPGYLIIGRFHSVLCRCCVYRKKSLDTFVSSVVVCTGSLSIGKQTGLSY